jgi:hypothetical protein
MVKYYSCSDKQTNSLFSDTEKAVFFGSEKREKGFTGRGKVRDPGRLSCSAL